RYDEWMAILERAHATHLDAGETRRAVRCAFWIGTDCARRGEMARASGWLGRAHRLLERETEECVEHGYLLLPRMFQHEAEGDLQAAADTAETAARIGERYGDTDLFALAVMAGGDLLVKQGRVKEGLALLDEAMVTVTTQPVSPIVAGLVYCGVIAGYRQGEVHRLSGELAEAERAYRQASLNGWEPQPGLALVRLAQGDTEAADAAIRRAVGETQAPLRRAHLLPAYVEILLARGDGAE